MSKLLLRAFLPAILAAIPGSLFAVDGVVLIDQPHALAGGITTGDAPGFPVTITQPGSYKLSGPLTIPDSNTDAILVAAAPVTIDLNGFSINGPNVCTQNSSSAISCTGNGNGRGIIVNSVATVSILNGTIKGMGGFAISGAGSGPLAYIDHLVVQSNGGGIFTPGTVTNTTALLNGGDAIRATAVRDCLVDLNGGIGVLVSGVASGNTITNNGGAGLFGFNSALIGNMVQGNGIGLQAQCPSVVFGNTVNNNGGSDQIQLSDATCVANTNTPDLTVTPPVSMSKDKPNSGASAQRK